jgi:hypothetical protein
MKEDSLMTTSIIRMLDGEGEFHDLCSYSLDPKKALIAYYMQQEKKSFNTWDYPAEVDAIQERPMGLGYMYNKGDAVIYSRPEESDYTSIVLSRSQAAVH